MAEAHLDHPGDLHWFKSEGPHPIVGPCPHTTCRHHAQSVIAWGPDHTRYELVTCDVDEHCAGNCRSWTDGSARSTSPWLQVDPVAALAGGPSQPTPTEPADDTQETTS